MQRSSSSENITHSTSNDGNFIDPSSSGSDSESNSSGLTHQDVPSSDGVASNSLSSNHVSAQETFLGNVTTGGAGTESTNDNEADDNVFDNTFSNIMKFVKNYETEIKTLNLEVVKYIFKLMIDRASVNIASDREQFEHCLYLNGLL